MFLELLTKLTGNIHILQIAYKFTLLYVCACLTVFTSQCLIIKGKYIYLLVRDSSPSLFMVAANLYLEINKLEV